MIKRWCGVTVFARCCSGGIAAIESDHWCETFRPRRETCCCRIDEHAAGYVELTRPMKPGRDFTTVDYIFASKDRTGNNAQRFRSSSHRFAMWLDISSRTGISHVDARQSLETQLARDTPTQRAHGLHRAAPEAKNSCERFFAESSHLRFEFPRCSVCGFFLIRCAANLSLTWRAACAKFS